MKQLWCRCYKQHGHAIFVMLHFQNNPTWINIFEEFMKATNYLNAVIVLCAFHKNVPHRKECLFQYIEKTSFFINRLEH